MRNEKKMARPFSCDFTTSLEAGNVEFHMHSHHEIFFLLEGNIQYFAENACYPMTSGSLILFSVNEIHKAVNVTNAPFTRLVIHIQPKFVQPYCTPVTNLLACFHREPGVGNLVLLSQEEQARLLSMATSLGEIMKNQERFGNDVEAVTLYLQILVFVNRAWKKAGSSTVAPLPHRTQAIMDYVDTHLTDTLTLDSIAGALALDKYYLSHLFKSETGSTIFQYVLVKRIALAKTLLSQGHTVAESCHLSGFNDYSNFIRSFKQITGYTPGQFRGSV